MNMTLEADLFSSVQADLFCAGLWQNVSNERRGASRTAGGSDMEAARWQTKLVYCGRRVTSVFVCFDGICGAVRTRIIVMYDAGDVDLVVARKLLLNSLVFSV